MNATKHSTYDVRVRAVAALREGMPAGQVAQAYQINRTTLYRWQVRFDQAGGTEGLLRSPGSGRPRHLQDLGPNQWRDIVLAPASNFGFETDFWTAKRVHQVVTQQFGASVSQRTV